MIDTFYELKYTFKGNMYLWFRGYATDIEGNGNVVMKAVDVFKDDDDYCKHLVIDDYHLKQGRHNVDDYREHYIECNIIGTKITHPEYWL